MVQIYGDKDADLSVLKGRTVAIIGYGNQGAAQAQCMKDSGLDVIIGLVPGMDKTWEIARKDGFEVFSIAEAAKKGDIIHMLIPDTVQARVYKKDIKRHMKAGKTLCFSHGFNIRFKTIVPPANVDVIMVAPKGPGLSVREMYSKGFGVPALVAVEQDYTKKAKQTVLALAKSIGATKAGVIDTTFSDETESDLIGEQTVLVGGIMELIKNGFEVLVENGYPPELAYFEACNETKLIVDQIYRNGIMGMLKAVSDTAKYGGLVVGPNIVDARVKKNMQKAVKDVQSGKFARAWLREDRKGRPVMNELMKQWETSLLEKTGDVIRRMSEVDKKA